jgi:hypothetical protein
VKNKKLLIIVASSLILLVVVFIAWVMSAPDEEVKLAEKCFNQCLPAPSSEAENCMRQCKNAGLSQK